MPPEHDRLRVARIESAVLPMAQAALDAGQFETAGRLYARLLDVDPASVDARMGLGDVALARRTPSQAANWYLAAAGHARAPGRRHAALLAHGRAALAAGDLDAARASFARLADPGEHASEPDVAWGFNGVGVVNLLEGRPLEAVAAMEQATLRLPDEEKFRGNLSRMLKLASRLPAADSPRAPVGTSGAPEPQPIGNAQPAPTEVSRTGAGSLEDHLAALPDPDEPAAAEVRSSDSDAATPEVPESGADTAPRAAPRDAETTRMPGEVRDPPPNALATRAPDHAVVEPASGAAVPKTGSRTPGDAAQPESADARQPGSPGPRVSFPDAFVVDLESGRFLQVGAYARRENAEAARSRILEVVGLPVETLSAAGDLIHRVRIGPIPTRQSLFALARALGAERPGLGLPLAGESSSAPNDAPPTAPARRSESPSSGRADTPIHVVENGAGYLQVGAYADRHAAAALAARLREVTEHAVTLSEIARGDESTLYRVRIGPIDADEHSGLLRQVAAR